MKIIFYSSGRLKELEISPKTIALIIGAICAPISLLLKLIAKAIIILSIVIHGLTSDHASFYEDSIKA
jgi:hypothetical protein